MIGNFKILINPLFLEVNELIIQKEHYPLHLSGKLFLNPKLIGL